MKKFLLKSIDAVSLGIVSGSLAGLIYSFYYICQAGFRYLKFEPASFVIQFHAVNMACFFALTFFLFVAGLNLIKKPLNRYIGILTTRVYAAVFSGSYFLLCWYFYPRRYWFTNPAAENTIPVWIKALLAASVLALLQFIIPWNRLYESFTRKRLVYVRKCAAFLILGMLILSVSVHRLLGLSPALFDSSSARLVERSANLAESARTFNENRALEMLSAGPACSGTIRLDGSLKPVYVDGRSGEGELGADKSGGECVISFCNELPEGFEISGGSVKTGFESVKVLKKGETSLSALLDPAVPIKDIGEIAIVLRIGGGSQLKLGWCRDKGQINWSKDCINLAVAPGSDFKTYRLKAETLFNKMSTDEKISRIGILLPYSGKDMVELKEIRIESKLSRYSGEKFGESQATVGSELRKAIFLNAPGSLRFRVDVPGNSAKLSFGLGRLSRGSPLDVEVVVSAGEDGLETIYNASISDHEVWLDSEISLEAWQDKVADITFTARSTESEVLFISSPSIHSTPEKRFNVVIYLEDSLRADHLSLYGYDRHSSPVKDKWAGDGVIFQNAFSQATKTRPSIPSILTSLYPTATGVWHGHEALDESFLTLPEILRSTGFTTGAFIQNGNAGPFAGLHQGYDSLLDYRILGRRADTMLNRDLFRWMDKNYDKNFFLYVHLADPHCPYDPPAPFNSWYNQNRNEERRLDYNPRFDPEWAEVTGVKARRNLYDGEIAYNDSLFSGFLAKLDELDIREHTLVVFIADHGEHLGEHGEWEHHPPGFDQVIHVPLIMVYPEGLAHGKRIGENVQLIDIMPTILELAGIDASGLLIQGDSLLDLIQGLNQSFWSERTCYSEEVTGKEKYDSSGRSSGSLLLEDYHILSSDVRLRTLLFDRSKDPEELFSIFSPMIERKSKKILQKIQSKNMEIWESVTGGNLGESEVRFDVEYLENLKGLGYIQ